MIPLCSLRDQSADIYKAFKPYYERADMGEAPDPQRLYKLHRELLESGVVNSEEVQSFCSIWFSKRGDGTTNHQKLNALIDLAVERFTALAEKEQDMFRGKLGAFRNLYAFLSQIIPYGDSELEKGLCLQPIFVDQTSFRGWQRGFCAR